MKFFGFAATTLVALSSVGQTAAQTPSGFSPAINATLSVTFGSGSDTAGSSVALEKTQVSPAISLPKLSSNASSYVLLMVDVDAPNGIGSNKNSYAPFLHWLTPLSTASSDVPSNQSATAAVAPYIGPAPPVGTGKHRYVILLFSVPSAVFQWPSELPAFDATKLESRIQFDYNKFATAGDFTPIAASWFTTENKTTVYTAGASNSVKTPFAPRMAGVAALVSLAILATM